MTKTLISTDKAPAAIGPYSQAVEAGGWVYLSGQISLDPASGELVGDNVSDQTKQVLKNMEAVLEAAGLQFSHVVKTNVYLKSMDDFPTVNEIYGGVFSENPPARACIQAAKLPKDVLVEIDAVAFKG